MKLENLLKSLSLREKLLQMFILGFSGEALSEENLNIQKSIKQGLGGVILFSQNIKSYEQAAKLTEQLQKLAPQPLFVSIDQEGGRVERTINIPDKINYLSPGEIASAKNPDYAKLQADIMSKELGFMGVNMNFAPVIDVNTNAKNPIIGVRSFGGDADTVIGFAREVYGSFAANSIIPVIKHFPGHGDTREDSHLTMPVVDLKFEELENQHIKPFIEAIKDGVDLVMVNHVYYQAFDASPTPASLSENVIKYYLRDKIGYQGLVVSDDMVMGGIKNYYKQCNACLKGIEAGVDLFIFRDSSDKTLEIVDTVYQAVKKGDMTEARIDESVKRILICKDKYNLGDSRVAKSLFSPEELQKQLLIK